MAFLPSVSSQGKLAPLLPEEYATYYIQRKWNQNGFAVNHTEAGVQYSSFANQMMRADGTAFASTDNWNQSIPIPPSGQVMMSLLDFTQNPPLNTYYIRYNLVNSSCAEYPIVGFFAPPPSNFLRITDAVYAGNYYLAEYGNCDKWDSFVVANTIIEFYFDKYSNWVRYDIVGSNLETSVNTNLYGLQSFDAPLPKDIFMGSGMCSQKSKLNNIN